VRLAVVGLALLVAREAVNFLWERDRFFLDGFWDFFWTAVIFTAVRALVRPVLMFLTCPLQLLTLGLFSLVVDALILLLTELATGVFGVDFEIDGFWPALAAAVVVALVSFAATSVLRRQPLGPRLLR
jgi:uncharacterized membrane protein YvlD (DUF360 family)